MKNFDLKKYLAENRLLKESLSLLDVIDIDTVKSDFENGEKNTEVSFPVDSNTKEYLNIIKKNNIKIFSKDYESDGGDRYILLDLDTNQLLDALEKQPKPTPPIDPNELIEPKLIRKYKKKDEYLSIPRLHYEFLIKEKTHTTPNNQTFILKTYGFMMTREDNPANEKSPINSDKLHQFHLEKTKVFDDNGNEILKDKFYSTPDYYDDPLISLQKAIKWLDKNK